MHNSMAIILSGGISAVVTPGGIPSLTVLKVYNLNN